MHAYTEPGQLQLTPLHSTPTHYISTVEMYARCDNIVRKKRKRSIEHLFQLELHAHVFRLDR